MRRTISFASIGPSRWPWASRWMRSRARAPTSFSRRGRALLPGRSGGYQLGPTQARHPGRDGNRQRRETMGADRQNPLPRRRGRNYRRVGVHRGHHRAQAGRGRAVRWRQSSSLPTMRSCPRTSTASSRPGTQGRNAYSATARRRSSANRSRCCCRRSGFRRKSKS